MASFERERRRCSWSGAHRRLLRPAIFFVFFFVPAFFLVAFLAVRFLVSVGLLFAFFLVVTAGLGLDQISFESSTSWGAFVGGTRGIWSQIPGPPRPLSFKSVEVTQIPSEIDDPVVSASVRSLASTSRNRVDSSHVSLVITALDFAAELFLAWHHIF